MNVVDEFLRFQEAMTKKYGTRMFYQTLTKLVEIQPSREQQLSQLVAVAFQHLLINVEILEKHQTGKAFF